MRWRTSKRILRDLAKRDAVVARARGLCGRQNSSDQERLQTAFARLKVPRRHLNRWEGYR